MTNSPLTILFFTLLIAGSVSAQKLTIHAGPNMSKWTGEELLTSFDSRTSFHIGLNYELPMSENFSLGPGFRYQEKGARLRINYAYEDQPGVNVVEKSSIFFDFDYLEILLQMKYKVRPKLSLIAEPYVGIPVESISRFRYVTCLDGMCTGIEFNDDPDPDADYGVSFGASYDIFSNAGVSFLYQLGVAEVWEDLDIHNRSLMLSLYVKI